MRYAPEFVDAVRIRYESGATQTEIAAEFGTTQKVIFGLMRRNGIKARVAAKRDQRGPANSTWRQDSTNYVTLHNRVEAARGKPQECESCGTTDARRYEWANLTGDYCNVDDYARMCVGCHRRFDAARRRETGRPTCHLPR